MSDEHFQHGCQLSFQSRQRRHGGDDSSALQRHVGRIVSVHDCARQQQIGRHALGPDLALGAQLDCGRQGRFTGLVSKMARWPDRVPRGADTLKSPKWQMKKRVQQDTLTNGTARRGSTSCPRARAGQACPPKCAWECGTDRQPMEQSRINAATCATISRQAPTPANLEHEDGQAGGGLAMLDAVQHIRDVRPSNVNLLVSLPVGQ